MKKIRIHFITMVIFLCGLTLPALSQDNANNGDTSAMLNMAGDNLDLYAVLELFQKSKTIEEFEKSLNEGNGKEKINNLDLNLDKKVDFIKVVTEKDGNSFRFILRDDISKKESQDVAVILVDKGKDDKVSVQIVGDEELYGKDYVVEPKGNSSVTANPAYTGVDPVTINVPSQQVTVVQSPPIVQYVYSPAYVPYYPPYYYGYYPPWFGFATVMAVGIYRSNHWYGGYHGHYHGGHYHGGGNTVIINNRNSINHYNNSRNVSNTVKNNRVGGNYGSGNRTSNRAGVNNNRTNNRNTIGNNNNRGGGSSGLGNSNRPSTSTRPSTSNRPSTSASTRPSTSNRSSSGFGSSGGGRSMSSGMGGGGARMGGGGGGRRR